MFNWSNVKNKIMTMFSTQSFQDLQHETMDKEFNIS